MFDMNHTGKTIADGRKAKNMTQMELADTLNISFQAVSNWERGISMPDISKLPELSELLEIPLDELLGRKSTVIEDVLQEGSFTDVTAEDIEEAAPLLKATQLDTIVDKASSHLNSHELRRILPYLSQNSRNVLFRKMLEQRDTISARAVASHISREVIDQCFADGLGDASLLYFAGLEGLRSGAWDYWCKYGCGRDLRRYLAALKEHGDSVMSEKIALAEYEKNGTANLRTIVFHLMDDTRIRLAVRIIENEGVSALSPIIFWLDKEKLGTVLSEENP